MPNLDLSQSQSRRPKDGGDPAFSILAVLVVFNRGLDAIPCVPQLRRWLEEAHADAGLRLSHVLIYDNSDRPSMGPAALRPGRYDYIHDASNGGTRAAYHAALRRAQELGCEWLLLLDHDTTLPEDYLRTSYAALSGCERLAQVGALVPIVRIGEAVASPAEMTSYGRVIPISPGRTPPTKNITAIASSALIRTAHLAAIAPIPPEFGLDYLDHWLFRALTDSRKIILVSTAEVQHSLSVRSMKSMSPRRYEAALRAEWHFLSRGPTYSALQYLLWHLLRTVKLALLTHRLALIGVCIRHVPVVLWRQ